MTAGRFAMGADRPFAQRFIQSNVSSLGSPIISLLAVNILTPVYHVDYLLANSLGIVPGLVWNWRWSTRVVWRQPAAAAVEKSNVAGPDRHETADRSATVFAISVPPPSLNP